jgi:ribosome recycling factor
MEMAALFLEEQLARIRAGRANIAILSGVRVESYGQMVPLNQVANVSTPDPRTIALRPWDKKMIKAIEKAIMDSDVGITPENNGEIVRLGIPQPTEERRRELAKQCNKIGEKAKVEVRNVRSDIKERLKKAIKDGLSEDNEKDAELELQKVHDKFIKKIDELLAAKNKEIMTV